MLQFILDHSGALIILTLGIIVFYFVVKVAVRAEQTRTKRGELMERVKRLQKKLDADNKE